MRIPFLGPSYEGRSVSQSAQKTVNWYPELAPKDSKSSLSLLPTPGCRFINSIGTGPIRGALEHDGYVYVVSGNQVFRFADSETATLMGAITTYGGSVSMASSGSQAILVDDSDTGYLLTGTTVTTLTNSAFRGAKDVVFMDGYFIVNRPGSGEFYISGLFDGSTWTALNFGTTEIAPDNLLAMFAFNENLYMFGEYTTQVFYNAGSTFFPFENRQGAFMEWGIAARDTISRTDDSIFWLAKNRQGTAQVVRTEGFRAKIVSTRALEHQISEYASISNAFAFTLQWKGHTFYVLTFPVGDATHVYDVETNTWFQWKTFGIGRHLSNAHFFINNSHYVGDFRNGNYYELDDDTYTDNSETIERIRRTQHQSVENKNMFWHKVEIDFEPGRGTTTGQGVDPQAMLKWSDDGGFTWSSEIWRDIGRIGEYSNRAVWYGMGRSRNRVYELTITDPIKAVVLGAYAEVDTGTS